MNSTKAEAETLRVQRLMQKVIRTATQTVSVALTDGRWLKGKIYDTQADFRTVPMVASFIVEAEDGSRTSVQISNVVDIVT